MGRAAQTGPPGQTTHTHPANNWAQQTICNGWSKRIDQLQGMRPSLLLETAAPTSTE
jgi:hypothetical protein